MLAYAANRRPAHHLHPKTLALIVAGHAGLLFALMTARGDIVLKDPFEKTVVTLIDPLDPPPPPPPEAKPVQSEQVRSTIDTPPVIIPTPVPLGPAIEPGPPVIQPGPVAGEAIVPVPVPIPTPPPVVKVGPKALTSDADLTPPYPDDKLRMGEEAVIRLSLGIDPRGRVVRVSPIGRADPSFVEAARKHILKRWRYTPATEGGVAVASSLNVSIRFAIDS